MIGPDGCTAFVHSDDDGEVRVTISAGLFDIPTGLIKEAARHGFVIYEVSGAPLTPIDSTLPDSSLLPVPETDASETVIADASPAVSQPVRKGKKKWRS